MKSVKLVWRILKMCDEKLLKPDLRILAIHGAKTTINRTPLVRFAWLFYNQTIFQKSVWHFFDQVARDAKNV